MVSIHPAGSLDWKESIVEVEINMITANHSKRKRNREQNLINREYKENVVFTILKIAKKKRIVFKISQIEKRENFFDSKS